MKLKQHNGPNLFSMHSPIPQGQTVAHQNFTFPGEDKLWLVIDSSETGSRQFMRFSAFLKKYWKIEEKLFMNFHIAASEAVRNAIAHGNKSNPLRQVFIGVTKDPDYYTVTIEDSGAGFDVTGIPDPTDPENILKEAGRGIFLMRALADHVHYTKGGRMVKLVFYRTHLQ